MAASFSCMNLGCLITLVTEVGISEKHILLPDWPVVTARVTLEKYFVASTVYICFYGLNSWCLCSLKILCSAGLLQTLCKTMVAVDPSEARTFLASRKERVSSYANYQLREEMLVDASNNVSLIFQLTARLLFLSWEFFPLV